MPINTADIDSPIIYLDRIQKNLGNGSTDALAAWDEAVDEANDGDTIVLGKGVYAGSDTFRFHGKELDLYGAGKDKTIMWGTGDFPVLIAGRVPGTPGPWIDQSANTYLEGIHVGPLGPRSNDYRPKAVAEIQNMLQQDTPFAYDSDFTTGNSLAFSLRIESSGLAAIAQPGDQIKLTADDIEMTIGSATYRYGRYFSVLGVDTTGGNNDVYVTNTTPFMFWAGGTGTLSSAGMPTANLRAAIVPRFSPTIADIGFRGDVGNSTCVVVEGCIQPQVRNIAIHESRGIGLRIVSTVGALVTGSTFNNCANEPDFVGGPALGWGVATSSTKSTKISNCEARFCRGAFSADARSADADAATLSSNGGCEDFRIENFANTASAVCGFDAGPMSSGSFNVCSSQDDYTGDLSGDGGGLDELGGVGFQFRGRRITARDCTVHNSRVGYLCTGSIARQCGDITLINCEAHASPHRGFYGDTQGGYPIDNILIQGGFYETDGFTEVVAFEGSTKAVMQGVRVKNRNGFLANDSCCVVMRGIDPPGGGVNIKGDLWMGDFHLDLAMNNSVTTVLDSGIPIANNCVCVKALTGGIINGHGGYADWDHDADGDVSHFFVGGDTTEQVKISGLHMGPRANPFTIRAAGAGNPIPAATPQTAIGYWNNATGGLAEI